MKKSQMLYSRGYTPRQYPKRDRGEKKTFRKKIIIFLWFLFLILILAYVLLLSPIFKIKEIKISGNRVIDKEEIRDSLNSFLSKKFLVFFNQNNIFLARENNLKNIIFSDFPRILSIEIKKNIFNKTIDLRIIERKEAGIFCRNNPSFAEAAAGKCYYIDKEGVIFEEAPQTSGTLILTIKDNSEKGVEIGRSAIDREFMTELTNLKDDLLSPLNLKVLDFIIDSGILKDLRVDTNEGWYILFDSSRDFKNQLQALRLVLEEKIKDGRKKLEYIDLRIENRVYYK